MAIKKSRLVQGVGVNDADYDVTVGHMVNGSWKITGICHFYNRWKSMLHRCYSETSLAYKPSYAGCSVCEEWLSFIGFKSWMEKQDWQGKELDKDLLFSGNKIYSPETCVFISQETNKFMTAADKSRGLLPLGVSLKRAGRYQAECRNPFIGKAEYLGAFKDKNEAHLAWAKRKREIAIMLSEIETDERAKSALKCRVWTQSPDISIIL